MDTVTAMDGARPNAPADLEALARVEAECFPGEAWTEAQLQGQLQRADGLALVLREQGEVVAAAMGWAAGGVAELLRIAVRPAWRGAGRGARLLAAFVHAAQARGAQELWLEVRADNSPALGLYAAAGLAVTGRRRSYYADGTDAVLMGRELQAPPADGLSG